LCSFSPCTSHHGGRIGAGTSVVVHAACRHDLKCGRGRPHSEDVIPMATAERPATARRTAGSRASTSAATRRTTRTTGTKRTRAAGRRPTAAETERRGTRRTTAKVPAAAATGRKPRTPRRVGVEARATSTERARRGAGRVRWTAMTLPVVNVRVPVLRVGVPGLGPLAMQTRWAAQTARANLPPMDRVLYYGGLGLMASVGFLEWPVAAAVGAGVWVAGRTGAGHRGQAASA